MRTFIIVLTVALTYTFALVILWLSGFDLTEQSPQSVGAVLGSTTLSVCTALLATVLTSEKEK